MHRTLYMCSGRQHMTSSISKLTYFKHRIHNPVRHSSPNSKRLCATTTRPLAESRMQAWCKMKRTSPMHVICFCLFDFGVVSFVFRNGTIMSERDYVQLAGIGVSKIIRDIFSNHMCSHPHIYTRTKDDPQYLAKRVRLLENKGQKLVELMRAISCLDCSWTHV